MAKDKKKEEEKPKKNDFKSFLKKRAPIYLGLIAMFIVFAVPELTKGDLESSFPELSAEEQQVIDILMGYNGPTEAGLNVMDAISNKISDEYGDEKIFVKFIKDNKQWRIDKTIKAKGIRASQNQAGTVAKDSLPSANSI